MMRAVLHRALLQAGAIFVPSPQRTEWLQEWTAELWHIEHQANPVPQCALTAFCLGAVRDGFALSRWNWRFEPRSLLAAGSAGRCLFLMALLCAASYTAARVSVNVRAHRQPVFQGFRQHLVLIRGERGSDPATATIEPEQMQFWRSRHQQIFDSFAFYQLLPNTAGIALARTSPNLFDLLGVPLHPTSTPEQRSSLSSAILSHELWVHRFASDPLIGGRVIELGPYRVFVRGVAPAGLRPLPGSAEAWLLTPDTSDFTPQPGFLIAQIAPAQAATFWKQVGMFSSHLPDGTVSEFFCTALEDALPRPGSVFLFNVIIASLALPAITTLSLGDYRLRTRRRGSPRLRRWAFLIAKLALLLPAVYLLSLDLAYIPASLAAPTADALQRTGCFAFCLFGLRWVLNDQRQRCPVCLSRLRHSARVGHPSQTFLAWNGTELACTGGHGLLHVPELPTSWFGTQRWLQLDSSWEVLFPKPAAPIRRSAHV